MTEQEILKQQVGQLHLIKAEMQARLVDINSTHRTVLIVLGLISVLLALMLNMLWPGIVLLAIAAINAIAVHSYSRRMRAKIYFIELALAQLERETPDVVFDL